MALVGGIDSLQIGEHLKSLWGTHTYTHTHTHTQCYPSAYQKEAHLRLDWKRFHKFIKLLPVISIMHL